MPPKAARQERGLFCSSKLPFGLRSPIPVLTPGPLACRAHRFEATQKRLKSASAQRVEAAEVVAEEKEALDGGRKEFNGTSLFRFVSEWKALSHVLACF